MKWTVSPILAWGVHSGGWEVESEVGRFAAPSEVDALILTHVLNEARPEGWGEARDAALKVIYAKEAAE